MSDNIEFDMTQANYDVKNALSKIDSKPDVLKWATRMQIYLHETMLTQRLLYCFKNGTKK